MSKCMVIPVVLLIIIILVPELTLAENALTNPGFETGNITGWTTWGCTLTGSIEQVYKGRYIL